MNTFFILLNFFPALMALQVLPIVLLFKSLLYFLPHSRPIAHHFIHFIFGRDTFSATLSTLTANKAITY